MKGRKIITSIFIMTAVVPAMAETFPADKLMQENKTYTAAATETNMDGVYENSVNANAQYTDIQYTITAGKYLPASAEAIADCTSGNYCPGLQSPVTYSTTTNQGLNTCPSGYSASDANASAETQCYRACDINNMGENGTIASIAHAASLTGNDYYGAGTDTCVPATCVHGYHVSSGSSAPDLNTLIGTATITGYVSNDYNGDEYDSYGGMTSSGAGISGDPMAFAVDYGDKGIIKGHGRCSTSSVTNEWYNQNGYTFESDHFVDTLADETDPDNGGQYCYCQLDGYTPNGGTLQSLSSSWVFSDGRGDADVCAYDCATSCANRLRRGGADNLAFRAAVFGAVTGGESGPAICEANTITINWDGADTADITANNAGTAIYDGDVRTPVKAVHIPGKRFTGWLFSNPNKGGNN